MTQPEWLEVISRDIDNDIRDKIHFTIESFEDSMIFFLHTVDISSDNNLRRERKEYVVENLYISIVSNNSEKTEELLLVNMEDIEYVQEDKFSKIKEN